MLHSLKSTARLHTVDDDIFKLRYFAECLSCTFCGDSCCQYGCDVNLNERDAILKQADSLSKLVPVPKEQWFHTEIHLDAEYPTGQYVRTQKVENRCVFSNRKGRGCLLHTWALQNKVDYHDIKPHVCWMFPITYDLGLLRPNSDVKDDLVCVNQGLTLYRSVRDELAHFFGQPLVEELDLLEAHLSASSSSMSPAPLQTTQV